MPYDYSNHSTGLNSPAIDAASVTPSDSVALTGGVARGIYVGSTGDVRLVTAAGTTITFTGVPAGVLPVRTSAVMSTSTTATGIVALY